MLDCVAGKVFEEIDIFFLLGIVLNKVYGLFFVVGVIFGEVYGLFFVIIVIFDKIYILLFFSNYNIW